MPVSVGVVQGERMRDSGRRRRRHPAGTVSARVPSPYAETTTGRIFPRFG
ncbi:hypothetical protein ACE0DR_28890 [Azotobacter sp. CWF10]